jgi:tetratricopeptide (TPR) repeat protein
VDIVRIVLDRSSATVDFLSDLKEHATVNLDPSENDLPEIPNSEPKAARKSGVGKIWIAVMGLVAVAALFFVIMPNLGPPNAERIQAAAEAGKWAQVISMTESLPKDASSDLIQLRLRALLREGKLDPAIPLLSAVKVESLKAEDLFVLGKALVEQHREALGWLAIEASSKLDPRFAETRNYLQSGREARKSLGTASSQIDRLATIPDPQAFATLVVGLTTAKVPTLDFITRRDRRDFLKLTNPAAVTKLLARLSLEQGRPDEAMPWLEQVKDGATDPETNWLLSRGHLSAGRFDGAVNALKKANGYGQDTPLMKEPCVFTGAKSCTECHGAIYRSQQSSRHAGTITRVDGLKSVPIPKGPVIDPINKDVIHRFDRKGDGIEASAEVDRKLIKGVVAFVMGSGQHGQTMIALDEAGKPRSLRISHYSGNNTWDLTEKFRPVPADHSGYLGDLLGPNEFTACLNCHSTRYMASISPSSPETQDRGIGCERCHGPGDHHIKSLKAGFPELAIARPKAATHADRMALCAQCHIATGEIPPSDPRFMRFQATTLPYSRCFTESGGQIDCVTCHNPHTNVETRASVYESKCLACHVVSKAAANLPAKAKTICKVNSKSDCLSCHMPKSADVMPGTTFTDHHIRIHK